MTRENPPSGPRRGGWALPKPRAASLPGARMLRRGRGMEHLVAGMLHPVAGLEENVAGLLQTWTVLLHPVAGTEHPVAGMLQTLAGLEHTVATLDHSSQGMEHSAWFADLSARPVGPRQSHPSLSIRTSLCPPKPRSRTDLAVVRTCGSP